MTGTVELDRDGTQLLIRFPYREDLVSVVKTLPNRRWDPKGKTWRVPAKDAELVYKAFVRHLFDFAPEIMSLVAGTLGEVKDPRPAAGLPFAGADGADADAASAGPSRPSPADALTISRLNQRVRDALQGGFPEPLWVVGEITDLDKQAGKKHLFFQLVEKQPNAHRPRAAVEVALFERTAQTLLGKLASGSDPVTLRDGIEIRALVRVDLYVGSGRFQLVIEDIDPTFTLGKLALSREQVLRELRDKGLAERNRSLPLPLPPLRLAVLASPDSDGWSDFHRHLEESGIGFVVTLLPVKVQGIELKPVMLAGLHWFTLHAQQFDVLCILRGGGSRTDLAWFDDRDIALAVARHPLKVLVGIGHQRDQSVLDVIAHAEKTPTAVAEHLVRAVEQTRAQLQQLAAHLRTAVDLALLLRRSDLRELAAGLSSALAARLQRERNFLGTAARDLHARALLRCQHETTVLQRGNERLARGTQRIFERRRGHLDHQATRRRLLDPARVLGRGYALVRDAGGKVLPSARRLRADQTIFVRMRDGTVRSRTEQVDLDG